MKYLSCSFFDANLMKCEISMKGWKTAIISVKIGKATDIMES